MRKGLVLSFMLIFFSVFAVASTGCDNGAEDGSPSTDETEAADDASVNEHVDQNNAADLDASNLWAPPVDKPSLNVANLPKKDEVPYPLYPGALAHNYGYAGENRESKIVWLLTTSSPNAVFEFYKEQLTGWQYTGTRYLNYRYVLWQGEDGDESAVYTHLIPAILIRELHEEEIEFMHDWLPETITEIQVVY